MKRTLHRYPPDLRTETLRLFARRLREFAVEGKSCADIAQQLDLVPLAAELQGIHTRIDAAHVAVVGCAQ